MRELLILFVLFVVLALVSEKPKVETASSRANTPAIATIDTEPEPPSEQVVVGMLPTVPSRTQLVTEKLEEAWDKGFRSYGDLIAYVKDETGQGCSRRTVAEWKKSRGLG